MYKGDMVAIDKGEAMKSGPVEPGEQYQPPPGMGMRDQFAAAALTGFLAHQSQDYAPLADKITGMLASEAYRLADAMLLAR